MKNGILGALITLLLIIGAAGAWYFTRLGSNNSLTTPTTKSTTPASQASSINPAPSEAKSFADQYKSLTQTQKDCLLNAVGQTKLNGFLNNDPIVMLTITGDDYARASACQK